MIRRGKCEENFSVLPNETGQDSDLSFEARGILWYLLTKPVDWQVKTKDLQREGKIGRDKVRSIIKELEEAGYLVRERTRHGDGRLGEIDYVAYSRPHMQESDEEPAQDVGDPAPENPSVESEPAPENPATGLPAPVNTSLYKGQTPTKDLKGQRTEAADATQPDLLGEVSPKKKPRNKHPIPDGVPDADDLAAARAHWADVQARGLDASEEAERFRDYHKAHGTKFVDWHAAWRTWFKNAVKFQRKDAPRGGAAAAPDLPEDQRWRTRIEGFRDRKVWAVAWGPKPGEAGCAAPKELVTEILQGRKVA